MRFVCLVAWIAFASSCTASSGFNHDNNGAVNPTLDAGVVPPRALGRDHEQIKRRLRWNDDDETTEDRGMEKIDDVVEKLAPKADDTLEKILPKADDAVEKAVKMSSKWNPALLKQVGEHTSLVKQLSQKYPAAKDLSLVTLRQLGQVEKLRVTDIAKGTKKTGDGMRRKIEPFEGMKVAPKQFLESHVGRENQLFGKDGSRLLSAAVVSRSAKEGGGDVLLISSSNPKKNDWLLPKGGWDKGEDVKRSALREVVEEGGVSAQLTHNLRRLKFSEGEKKYTYYAYKMKSSTVYDDWAESIRYRLWVSYDDAVKMLAKRPHMVDVVKRAQKIDSQVKAGKLPEIDPKMKKFTLAME